MSTVTSIKMKAKQFLQLGPDPEGVRLELFHGEIIVSPSPTPEHSRIEKRLSRILLNHIFAQNLGELFGDTDTILDAYTVFRPDLAYYAKSRLHLVSRKSLEGPPDLCVEIISPSSIDFGREHKFNFYQSNGVANYWIIDPEARSAEAFALRNGLYSPAAAGRDQEIVHLPPFAGLAIALGELWWPV